MYYAELVQMNIQMIHADGLTEIISLNLKANHQTLTCREADQSASSSSFWLLKFAAVASPELIIYNKPCTREQLHKGNIPSVYSRIMKNNSLNKQALCVYSRFNIIGTQQKWLFPAISPSVQTETALEKPWDDLLQIKKKNPPP